MIKKAWIVSVDMGYGHQRAAYPLKDISYKRIITANSDKIITPKEKRRWARAKWFYEGISRFSGFPLIGRLFFEIYNLFQRIPTLYPFIYLRYLFHIHKPHPTTASITINVTIMPSTLFSFDQICKHTKFSKIFCSQLHSFL